MNTRSPDLIVRWPGTVMIFFMAVFPFSSLAQNDQQIIAPPTQVRIQVTQGCILNGVYNTLADLGTLDFGDIYRLDQDHTAISTLGSGTIQLRCTPGTSAQILIDGGMHGSGVHDRRMRHATLNTTISYQVYSSSSYLTLWDDVLGLSLLFDSDAILTIPIYARISAQPTPASGDYSDTLTVTVNY